ncbi:hypothetical protein GCM10023196_069200 [Actinoallomurus vinaceus]|uniref:Uncharacterized protein n=2 Tax=Actinoallomurus vinaceus TaxID=1080074 RepID=A0ABP8UKV5_9ACTN
MTEHVKALPRLFDELASSQQVVHADTEDAIAVGFAIVNASETFISPDRNKRNITIDAAYVSTQAPHGAARTMAKLRELPRRTSSIEDGFDAFGVMIIKMTNDGGPIGLVDGLPAPDLSDDLHYERMLERLVYLYEAPRADAR